MINSQEYKPVFQRSTLPHLFLCILALVLSVITPPANSQTIYPLVIENGRVIDPETKLDAIQNIAIKDGKIAAISNEAFKGEVTINASGLVVSPGFIDLHSHSPTKLGQDYQVLDGVTTALELETGSYPIGQYASEIESQPRVNFGTSVSHMFIRLRVKNGIEISHLVEMNSPKPIGFNGLVSAARSLFTTPNEWATEVATETEIKQMKSLLHDGIDQGALGIGLPLDYVSEGVNNKELTMVFEVAATRDVPIFIHLRRGINGDPSGLDEVLNLAKSTGARLHICHITHNAMKNIELFLAKIREANDAGVDVTTEVLPYNAGSTTISAAVFKRDWQTIFDIGYEDVEWMATGERFNEAMWHEYQASHPNGQVAHHYVKEEWTQRALTEPNVMIVSDLLPMESREKNVAPHNGSFSRVLGRYVRELPLIDLPTAIEKMTLLPALRLESISTRFKYKGRLQLGADADITIFNPNTVLDKATYSDPYQASEGIIHVVVNGQLSVKNGELTEHYPGKRLN
jgi:N-acyl-D-aspartate/D-glutamate deacylase